MLGEIPLLKIINYSWFTKSCHVHEQGLDQGPRGSPGDILELPEHGAGTPVPLKNTDLRTGDLN